MTTSTTNLLNIAQSFSAQTVEHSNDLSAPELQTQHGNFNVVEGITTALSTLTEGMESTDECDAQPLNVTQRANIRIVENNAVNIEMVMATDKETTTEEFRKPKELLAYIKLSDEMFRAPLIVEEEF